MSIRALLSPAIAVTVTIYAASTLSAQVTTGVTLNFDAATDVAGNAVWVPDIGGGIRDFSFLSNQSPGVVSDAATPGITRAYSFPAARATAPDYENFSENADATFEIWVKSGDDLGNHVLFETGGGTFGTGIRILDTDRVVFNTAQSPGVVAEVQVANPLTSRFHQIAGTIDFTGASSGVLSLYVDGQLAQSVASTGTFNDWSGADDAGLGRVNGDVAANGVTSSGLTNFNGEISIFRFYENRALTAAEVLANYSAVASAAPVGFYTPPNPVESADLIANWDAADPGSSSTTEWRPTSSVLSGLNWSLGAGSTVPTLTTVTSAGTLISEAYTFDGNDTATMGADWPNTTTNALVEAWIRPSDLIGREVILELGGNTDGSSFVLNENIFEMTAKDGGAQGTVGVDLTGALNGDFIQVAGYFDLDNDFIRLYLNGQEVNSLGIAGLNDYAGADTNALGSFGNEIGGNLSGFGGFTGDIALLRLYTASLSQSEALALVQANFQSLLDSTAVVPEPSTFGLAALGLMSLGLVGWRRRRRACKVVRLSNSCKNPPLCDLSGQYG